MPVAVATAAVWALIRPPTPLLIDRISELSAAWMSEAGMGVVISGRLAAMAIVNDPTITAIVANSFLNISALRGDAAVPVEL